MASTTEKTPKTKKAKKTAKVWEPLSKERMTWVAANARPAVSTCLCGCGGATKGRFVPGHDALLKEQLKATSGKAASEALATFGW